MSGCDYRKLASLIDEIINEDEHKEVNQLHALADMDEVIKLSYIKIIVNMAYSDDSQVDAQEYAEILSLIARLDLTTSQRVNIRSYIAGDSNFSDTEDLISIINKNCPKGNEKALHVSLVKDLLYVYKSVKGGKLHEFDFLNKYRDIMDVDEKEISLAEEAIDFDLRCLADANIDDDSIKKAVHELAAKAGAVGVPIAAIYMSGSVLGLSAAGMTSGLATLGLGGLLGFSSMATGIGVAVLIGVGAYQGIKYFTGSAEQEKNARRLIMLKEVSKNTQNAISILVEDINYICGQLQRVVGQAAIQENKLKKVVKAFELLSKTGTVLTNKDNSVEGKQLRLKCPRELNIDRLQTLTNDPTKQRFFDIVISQYVEKCIEVDSDEGKETKKLWLMRDSIQLSELRELVNIFDAIGYFNVKSIIKESTKDLANKTIDKLGSFFSNG